MDLTRILTTLTTCCILAASLRGAPDDGVVSGDAIPVARLPGAITALVAQHRFRRENIAVSVRDGAGRTLVAINETTPFKPASNLKLLTTAAALHFLGPDHVFETTLRATALLEDGRIDGAIVLAGSGDPNISGRFYDEDPTALLRRWGEELRRVGLSTVSGDLIVDDSALDNVRFLPSWDRRQEGRWFAAQISALSFNDNCVEVVVEPAHRVGSTARVRVIPACPLVSVSGSVRTEAGDGKSVTIHRLPGTNEIVVKGRIGANASTWRGDVTVDDPAFFFAETLRAVFEREGVRIEGKTRRKDPAEKLGTSGPLLVRHTSTLRRDLPVIHKRSQNLHAELLLKVLGAEVEGEGSVAGGERAVRRYLEGAGIPAEGLVLADGSGLSHENRATARLLTDVLADVRSAPYARLYLESLAVAGEGTLRSRFRGRDLLAGHVYAKTGSIRGVSTLSGYIREGGTTWSFSILINGYPPGSRDARGLQEKICDHVFRAMR